MVAKVMKSWIPLMIILLLGLVFRSFNFERTFFFAHDQDLYSWIAKDIIVNGHERLVGQLTSVDGVFIGSFYYYLMAVFYFLFRMDPLSAYIPVTIIGLVSIFSLFWIVSRNFTRNTGILAALIYAASFGVAIFDKWSVPTQPTLLWSIWFLGVILGLYKGNLKYLPVYGFLCGFVWQLHIALIPILPIPILAYLVGKNNVSKLWNKVNIRVVLLSILIFLVTISPFFMFEFKHNFLQVKSLAAGIGKDTGGVSGLMKFYKVMDASAREFQQRLWGGYFVKGVFVFWLVFGVSLVTSLFKKWIKWGIGMAFVLWFLLILMAQFVSKRVVSEYYFTNLLPVYIVVLSVFLVNFFGKRMLGLLVLGYVLLNLFWLATKSDYDQSYLYRRQVVEFIKNDSIKNKYPCVAVNFIADPGVGVGFRYLFWHNGISLVKPGTVGVPVYNIPIPWQLSMDEKPDHFGRFGVLKPVPGNYNATKDDCSKKDVQLDPLLGYTE